MYTDSCGYGGLLQAWALVRVLNEMGYAAEQLVLGTRKDGTSPKTILKKIRQKGIQGIFLSLVWRLKKVSGNIINEEIFAQTKQLCTEFRNSIPHSKRYDEDELYLTNPLYDAFIVGSDQVWNPYWRRKAYFLSFVMGKPKISYAASIANFDFSNKEKKQFAEAIEQFDAVSVREEKAVWFIKENAKINPMLVLDPTLLLKRESYVSIERKIEVPEKYMFCYFLNMNQKKRKLAQQIAEKQNLKIIYPIWYRQQELYDDTDREQTLLGIGPGEWLYLIHHASFVLTDSFHGLAFSIIYQKQFYHIPRTRKTKKDMNSRVDSLLTMFALEKQTIGKENNLSIENNKIDYLNVNQILEGQKQKSFAWLDSALKAYL